MPNFKALKPLLGTFNVVNLVEDKIQSNEYSFNFG